VPRSGGSLHQTIETSQKETQGPSKARILELAVFGKLCCPAPQSASKACVYPSLWTSKSLHTRFASSSRWKTTDWKLRIMRTNFIPVMSTRLNVRGSAAGNRVCFPDMTSVVPPQPPNYVQQRNSSRYRNLTRSCNAQHYQKKPTWCAIWGQSPLWLLTRQPRHHHSRPWAGQSGQLERERSRDWSVGLVCCGTTTKPARTPTRRRKREEQEGGGVIHTLGTPQHALL